MSYRPFDTSAEQDAVLDRLQALARPGAVFALDVDGCLMDTRHRQIAIFHAWAEITGQYGFSRVALHHFEDRDQVRTLVNAGMTEAQAREAYPDFRRFWGDRFFDDAHVELDGPMPGAARLVSQLHGAGATVVYLTGRHTSMRAAGERCFRRFGLPVDERAIFFDKPDERTEDHVHKVAMFAGLEALGEVVAAMDNEPINANLLAERFPRALVVFVESDCSSRPVTPHAGLPRIRGFLRTGE